MNAPVVARVWQCLLEPGMEHFLLEKRDDGWQLEGTVVTVMDGQPTCVTYTVQCSPEWQTQHVEVTSRDAQQTRTLTLDRDADSRWLRNGVPLAAVEGCIDVDLGITPATNTLPIRRLNLRLGEAADVAATWVQFPTLEIRVLRQRYTRTGERTYHYESDTGFKTTLVVDEHGIMTTYTGNWETLA